MIAKLTGHLDSIGEDWCLIDVNGVGYLVFCSGRTLNNLPVKGERVSLMIETHVREDHIHLFGFLTDLEKQWFSLLQTVQGVGAKVALAILSAASADELSSSIAAQDKAIVSRANGVGPKVATRIVNELKDNVAKSALAHTASVQDNTPKGNEIQNQQAKTTAPSDNQAIIADAVSALVNLGYGQTDAYVILNRINQEKEGQADLSTLIRLGLKELSI